MSDQQARQTPIIDLLRDIPADARMVYEVTPTHHQSIPVGVLAKKAADEIERLTDKIERLETDVRKLDFLELNGIGCDKIGGLGYSVWINGVRYDGDTARNAIDAAMRGSDE